MIVIDFIPVDFNLNVIIKLISVKITCNFLITCVINFKNVIDTRLSDFIGNFLIENNNICK